MNKVILMGRLTKDPELRYTSQNNVPVASFSIAVDKRVKAGEERQADFFNIVAWRNTAEFCSKYFAKGRRILIVGRMQNRTWDDAEGKRHYMTEVVADEVEFADSKPQEGSYQPANVVAPAPTPAPVDSADGFFPIDDDEQLPF